MADPNVAVDRFANVPLRMAAQWAYEGCAFPSDMDGELLNEEVKVISSFHPSNPNCPPMVLLDVRVDCFHFSARFCPEQARLLAAALLEAADVVEPLRDEWARIVQEGDQPCSSQ